MNLVIEGGTPWEAPGTTIFESGIEIVLEKPKCLFSLDISLDHNDHYEILGLKNMKWLKLTDIGPSENKGLVRHQIFLNQIFSEIEKIKVVATSGDRMFSLGHLLVNFTQPIAHNIDNRESECRKY